jgi:hypothetical protein
MTVADLCLTSEACKSQLNRRRYEQRYQSLRLYDSVEIGAATNYVADLLLKTESGTNALALLSAILPVMSKASSNATITFLFKKAGVPQDHTPSVGQLERLQDVIMPLLVKSSFKDKVLQYYAYMDKLVHSSAPNETVDQPHTITSRDIYDSIPHENCIADIILLLNKIVGTDRNVTFEVRGFMAAAWIAAYARDILGMPVCVFGKDNTKTASGDLTTAKVILRPCAAERVCLIREGETVREILEVQSLDDRKGWVVDLSRNKYFDILMPSDDASLRHLLNSIASSMTKSCVEVIARSCYWRKEENDKSEFQKFAVSHIQLLTQRAFSIMHTLGFECSHTEALKPWRDYFCIHQREKSSEPGGYRSKQPLRRDSVRKTTTSTHIVPMLLCKKHFGKSAVGEDNTACQGDDLNAHGRRSISNLMKAISFASTMAFTNWGTDFCNVSVSYLNEEFHLDEEHPLLWRNILYSMLTGEVDSGFIYKELIQYVLYITTDTIPNIHVSDFLNDERHLIATSFDGTVFVRTMAVESLADLTQPTFLSFYPGTILAGSEPRLCIKSAPSPQKEAAELVQEHKTQVIPTNAVPNLHLRHQVSLHRDVVEVQSYIYLGREYLQTVDPILISENIPTLFIPNSCTHGYSHPYQVIAPPKDVRTNRFFDEPATSSAITKILTGLSFQSHLRPKHMRWTAENGRKILYVQNVDGNRMGQWVACQWTQNLMGAMMVLQSEVCCLKCVDDFSGRTLEVCVINGGRGKDTAGLPRRKTTRDSVGDVNLSPVNEKMEEKGIDG